MPWEKTVKIRHSPFGLYFEGWTKKDLSKIVGAPLKFENLKYVDETLYQKNHEIERVDDFFEEHFELVPKILERINETSENFVSVTSKFPRDAEKLRSFSNEVLLELFKQYFDCFAECMRLVYMPLCFERILTRRIEAFLESRGVERGSRKWHHCLLVLTAPSKASESSLERESLLRIAADIKGGKQDLDIGKKAVEHAQTFGWITTKWLLGKPLTADEVLRNALEESRGKPTKKLENLKKVAFECESEFKTALRDLNATPEFEQTARLARETVFIRTSRLNAINKANFNARPFCEEIARRMGFSYEDFPYFLPPEVLEFLERGKTLSKQEIAERKKKYAMVLEDGKLSFYFGGDAEKIREGAREKEAEQRGKSKLRGSCAWKGRARGAARIVLSEDELGKVREGDVLVTPMTTPDFAPAFSKIVALVTDMGGITCHAAIVAREFGIPCVVGTRIATKTFKDGDIIEVDASHGVVKKISV